MNIKQLQKFIYDAYGTSPEYPWEKSPDSMVFRHSDNRKWFALVMNISKDKLGLQKNGPIDIINVKCDPLMIGSLQNETGIYPAYHMNKANWITIALDGSVSDEKIKFLLDMSYTLTAKKQKNNKLQ